MYYTSRDPRHPGGSDHLITLTAAQHAALRSGSWAQGTGEEHEPGLVDWALTISALADLEADLGGVTAAAIREHVRLGASVRDLARILGQPRYDAQRRRERAIGVEDRPVPPGPAELWARTAVRPAPTRE